MCMISDVFVMRMVYALSQVGIYLYLFGFVNLYIQCSQCNISGRLSHLDYFISLWLTLFNSIVTCHCMFSLLSFSVC